MKQNSEIIIYQTEAAEIRIKTRLHDETVWLNRHQMAELFDRNIKTIGKHINNTFNEGELDKNSVVAKFATTAEDCKTYQVEYYNLDVIISFCNSWKNCRRNDKRTSGCQQTIFRAYKF